MEFFAKISAKLPCFLIKWVLGHSGAPLFDKCVLSSDIEPTDLLGEFSPLLSANWGWDEVDEVILVGFLELGGCHVFRAPP